jgi:hypothetical protein
MKTNKWPIVISMLVIALGVAWLLNTLNIIASVDWVWTLGLAVAGILIIALGERSKLTFVIGPFLVISSIFSVLRQTGRIRVNIEFPILFIVLGLLMLIAHLIYGSLPRNSEEQNDQS